MWPVTAESTPHVNRQPMGSQQIRIAVLVVLAVVVGVVLWLVLGHSSKHHKKKNNNPALGIPATAFNAANLKAESYVINTKFFWAGKKPGYKYEFTRDNRGYLYVRYLPAAVHVGAKGAHYLIVATYPVTGAYQALKAQAGKKAVSGPDGSIVYIRPSDHRSVLMAFPGVNDQIEIFDPSPPVAISTAESRKIKPIR